MPKRGSRKNRKGGFLGFFENNNTQDPNKKSTWSSWFGSSSTTTTPTYSSTTPTQTSTYSSTSTTPTYSTQPYSSQTTNYGGKRRNKSKRGGYSANTPTTGLASTGAPFSGPTAKPQHWVGGKTKRRHHKKHRHSRKCRR